MYCFLFRSIIPHTNLPIVLNQSPWEHKLEVPKLELEVEEDLAQKVQEKLGKEARRVHNGNLEVKEPHGLPC